MEVIFLGATKLCAKENYVTQLESDLKNETLKYEKIEKY